VQANSGGGKSYALRYLLEQTHGKVPHIILDPEGEFGTLRERHDYLLVGKDQDIPTKCETAKLLCRKVMELGTSVVIDLYDLQLEERKRYVALFLEELMHLPRSLWRSTAIVIDECHVFAPERGAGESIAKDGVIALATQGRKRGFSLWAATQRLSKLHKDVAAELNNKLIGRTGLDIDLKRAGDELGLTDRNILKTFKPGQFFSYGPGLTNVITMVTPGAVKTTHPQPGQITPPPPQTPESISAMLSGFSDLDKEAEIEAHTMDEAKRQIERLKGQISQLQGAASKDEIESAVKEAVAPLQREVDALNNLIEQVSTLVSRRKVEGEAGKTIFVPTTSASVAIPHFHGNPPDYVDMPIESTEGPTIPDAQRRILQVLRDYSQFGLKAIDRHTLAVLSKQSPKSSQYNKHLKAMIDARFVERTRFGELTLLEAGEPFTLTPMPLPKGSSLHVQLQAAWMAKLPRAQSAIVKALLVAHPNPIHRTRLAIEAKQSPTSSQYGLHLTQLRRLGLIAVDKSNYSLTNLLFPAREEEVKNTQ
jgi:hypothetical protein